MKLLQTCVQTSQSVCQHANVWKNMMGTGIENLTFALDEGIDIAIDVVE